MFFAEVTNVLVNAFPWCWQYIGDPSALAEDLDKHPELIGNVAIQDEEENKFLRQGIENAYESVTYTFLTYLHKNNKNEVLVEGLNILREKQRVHHSEFSPCINNLIVYFA